MGGYIAGGGGGGSTGAFIKVFDKVPTAQIDMDSLTWADVGAGGDKMEGTFEAPRGGDYVFGISAAGLQSTGANGETLYFRLQVDGVAVEPSPNDKAWGISTAAIWQCCRGYWVTDNVTLAAGTRTVTLQYKTELGSRNMAMIAGRDGVSIDAWLM